MQYEVTNNLAAQIFHYLTITFVNTFLRIPPPFAMKKADNPK